MAETKGAPKVAIVGAGISGLTAALRLAQRGYKVTVYEEKPFIGGNLGSSSFKPDGRQTPVSYDVYSHMYSNVYHNFWELAENDLGLRRGLGLDFEPRTSAKVLDKGTFPQFKELENVGSFKSAFKNMFSGVASPADMLLWGYSMVDVLSFPETESADDMLDKVSVDGFMRTRPYATESVSRLHDDVLMTIWSIHSEETSMASYRRIVQPCFRRPAPQTWLLTGDLGSKLLTPLRTKLKQLGCDIQTNVSVSEVFLDQKPHRARAPSGAGSVAKATHVLLNHARRYDYVKHGCSVETKSFETVPIDAVILAIPPEKLANLVEADCEKTRQRIVDLIPILSQTRRLRSEPVIVLNLFFKRKLPSIPKEQVLLRDSRFDVTFLDLSQLWHNDPNVQGRTVLTVAASDFYSLPVEDAKESGQRMIRELSEYVPGLFSPGEKWGESSDIDWDCTHIQTNQDAELFVNVVGGKAWQPRVHYPEIPNLFFAGDCTINEMRMTTVESAVISGLQAASELCKQLQMGAPVEIQRPDRYPAPLILAMKTVMAPWAYAAMNVSTASDLLGLVKAKRYSEAKCSAASWLVDLYATPLVMAGDWWSTVARAFVR